MIRHFFEALQEENAPGTAYANRPREEGSSLRVIVATQYLRLRGLDMCYHVRTGYNTITREVLPHTKVEVLKSLAEWGLDVPEPEGRAIVDRAFQETNGYPWFFNRFVRASLLVRRWLPALTLEEVLRLVAYSSAFWYYSRDQVIGPELRLCLENGKYSSRFPPQPRDECMFLSNIHKILT